MAQLSDGAFGVRRGTRGGRHISRAGAMRPGPGAVRWPSGLGRALRGARPQATSRACAPSQHGAIAAHAAGSTTRPGPCPGLTHRTGSSLTLCMYNDQADAAAGLEPERLSGWCRNRMCRAPCHDVEITGGRSEAVQCVSASPENAQSWVRGVNSLGSAPRLQAHGASVVANQRSTPDKRKTVPTRGYQRRSRAVANPADQTGQAVRALVRRRCATAPARCRTPATRSASTGPFQVLRQRRIITIIYAAARQCRH